MTEAQSIFEAMSEDTGAESQPIPAPGVTSADGSGVGASLAYAVLVVVGVGFSGAALAERGTENRPRGIRPKRARKMRSACRNLTTLVKQVTRTLVTPAQIAQDCWNVPVIEAEPNSVVWMAKRTWTLAASSGMSRCSFGMAWTVWM